MGKYVYSRRAFLGTVSAGALASAVPLRSVRGQAPAWKIGILLPESGPLAQMGQASHRGSDLAAMLLNEKGGVDGRKIELIYRDFESNPDKARTEAERLAGAGVNAMIGCWESAATMNTAQVCERAQIPLVVNVASAVPVTESGFKYTFRNFPSGPNLITEGVRLMKVLFAAKGVSPKRAVMMHTNDTFGTDLSNAVKTLAPRLEMPFEITEFIAYDLRSRDLSVEVTKAKAAKPDILLAGTRLNDAILIVREMVKQNFSPMGLISPGSPGLYEKPFIDTLGKYADYAIANVPWYNPRSSFANDAVAAFAKMAPDSFFDLNVGFTFEAVWIAADAFRRASGQGGDAVREALTKTRIDTHIMAGGPITFNEKGQNTNINRVTVQNLKGKPTPVSPAEFAAADPVFPVPNWRQRG
jgi:branched-chain amino acid transport system substrate-binding protein